MSKRKIKTQFAESLALNMLSYNEYVDMLVELCISTFTWDGLPDTVDERLIELSLYSRGMAVYFKDDVIGDLCLQCLPAGKRDVYGVPINRKAYSPYNHFQMNLDNTNSVIIFNNLLRKPSFEMVRMYAHRLWDIDRTIDVNVHACKTPILITCDETERQTFENLYKEYDGNAPVIKGTKALNQNNFQVLKTDAPYLADKLYQLKTQIWNEALTKLGIANVNTQKKERLVQDEVGVTTASAVASRLSRKKARQQGADKINQMFGTKITVDFNPDLLMSNESEDEDGQNENDNQKKGGEDNE